MEILIFKTHFFKFEISKGAVIRSGMVQSDMWNKHHPLNHCSQTKEEAIMLSKVKSIISRELSIRPERIASENTLREDLDMDRADLLSVVTDLEDEYSIVIDYNKLDSIRTVADLDEYVLNMINS